MKPILRNLIIVWAFLGIASGLLVTFLVHGMPTLAFLQTYLNQIFIIHLVCWMIGGMGCNYFWDLFQSGKGWREFELTKLILPLLVSPIVLFPTWSLWMASKQDSQIMFELIAFQNGFFWQELFAKAGPILPTGGNPVPSTSS